MSGRESTPRASVRIGLIVALALLGALGVWPVAAGGGDPVVELAWIGLLAPGAGALAAGLGVAPLPFGWIVPAAWGLPVLAVSKAPRELPTPGWALLVVLGLYLVGAALGTATRRRGGSAWSASGLALLASATLTLLPARAALDARPWPPRAASALLDLAPATWVAESAGVDWMRHPAVYDPVVSDRLERRAARGALAGPLALLVGCALAVAARLVPARRTGEG